MKTRKTKTTTRNAPSKKNRMRDVKDAADSMGYRLQLREQARKSRKRK